MPNLSLTCVNQKLAYAKSLLQGMDESTLTPVCLNSLKEAAAFHLMCAYHHYLREIAETYWLKNSASIKTEADLIAAFQAAKKHPTEAEELITLRKEVNSWLTQLHTYYESLWSVPTVAVNDKQNDELLIKIVNLESSFNLMQVDSTLIASWCESFIALVLRQRATSAEF
ncbi:MAG: DUF6586 family protein [Pseudomonadota bacterium]